MKIDENYNLEPDKYCWVLRYRKEGEINPDTGNRILSTDETYHPSIKLALKKYMDSKLKGCESLLEISERINEVETIINKIK